MKEAKLSNLQLGLLIFITFYGTIAIHNPALDAKNDAWIAVILASTGSLILVKMCLTISRLNNGLTLTEIIEKCFGKIIGKIIVIFYIFFYMYKASGITRLYGEFSATVTYADTPLIALFIVFSLTILYATRGGISVLGKISEILVPLIPITGLILAVSISTSKDFIKFSPILLEISPVLKSTSRILSLIYADIFTFLLILPYTNNVKGRSKTVYLSTLCFGLLLLFITVRNIAVIGTDLLGTILYSSHAAAQMIPGLNIDPLIDASLLLGAGCKTCVMMYAICKMTADIFKLKEYKPLVSAFVVLNIVLAYLIFSQDALSFIKWSKSFGDEFLAFPVYFFFPLLMLIISIFKNRKNISKKRCSVKR